MSGLTSEEIDEFRELWREAFNEELTAGEAKIKAEQLLGLYEKMSRRLRDNGPKHVVSKDQ